VLRQKEYEDYRKWYFDRPETRKKRVDETRRYRLRLRLKVIELLGGKCIKCGNTDDRVLQVNHKNGGGGKEKSRRPVYTLFRDIIKGVRTTDDIDLRCANCNILYQYERGWWHREPILPKYKHFEKHSEILAEYKEHLKRQKAAPS